MLAVELGAARRLILDRLRISSPARPARSSAGAASGAGSSAGAGSAGAGSSATGAGSAGSGADEPPQAAKMKQMTREALMVRSFRGIES